MNKSDKNSEAYIEELEDTIIDLKFKLKNATIAFQSVENTHREVLRKLIHNLKNPIGVIFSFSEMILESNENVVTEKTEKHLNVIKNSANFSIQLLDNLAKYASLQSTDLSFNFKKINYIELLNNVCNTFHKSALEKNITLKEEFYTNELSLVLDVFEISIAISNILNNAIRYSKENTTITVSVIENSGIIETVISDEGIGISKEGLTAVLNEFYVVNTYSEDRQKCIGLGLPIANKIVELHKGKITISSSEGNGSSFRIILPKN